MARTTTTSIDKERIRLLADRLCWLAEGQDGLRWRHGMWRSDKSYRDKYDREAERIAPQVLKPRELPAIKLAKPEPKQMSMLEAADG